MLPHFKNHLFPGGKAQDPADDPTQNQTDSEKKKPALSDRDWDRVTKEERIKCPDSTLNSKIKNLLSPPTHQKLKKLQKQEKKNLELRQGTDPSLRYREKPESQEHKV